MPVRKKYALAFLLYPAVFPVLLAAGSSILPDYLDLPATNTSHSKTFTSAAQLEQFFGSAGYTLEQVREEKQLPQLYVTNLPSDLKKSTISQRTSLFIRLLLPTTTSANNQILTIRSKLSGSYLAGALLHYPDRGQAYVTTLRKLIRQHQLDELDNLQIDSNGTTTLIKFKR